MMMGPGGMPMGGMMMPGQGMPGMHPSMQQGATMPGQGAPGQAGPGHQQQQQQHQQQMMMSVPQGAGGVMQGMSQVGMMGQGGMGDADGKGGSRVAALSRNAQPKR